MKFHPLIAILLATAACAPDPVLGDFAVSPLPKEITVEEGAPFVFSPRTAIQAPRELETTARLLSEALEEATGMKPALSEKGRIILSIDPTLPEEGYRIQCRKNGIHITGGSGKGVFYGTQTLYKALPVHSQGRPALPAATVQDTPAFSYRGFMVDVGLIVNNLVR